LRPLLPGFAQLGTQIRVQHQSANGLRHLTDIDSFAGLE
jgi:hypothetical protein